MDVRSKLQQIYNPHLFETLLKQTAEVLRLDLQDNLEGRKKVINYHHPEDEYKFWLAISQDKKTLPWGELLSLILDRSIRIQHPAFIGHQVTAAAPLAAVGGLVSDYLNNGMGVYEMGGAAVAMERVIIEWVTEAIGFGVHRGGFLTAGGSLANLTALLSARNTWKRTQDHENLNSRPGVIISSQAHYSVERSVRILDMEVIKTPVTGLMTIDIQALDRVRDQAIHQGIIPVALVASAGTTATGSYDDLPVLARFCQKHSLWMHVDGAHGGCVVFTDKYKSLVDGIAEAQSVSIDFHKMMMIPALCTALVYQQPNDSYRTYAHQASYLFENEQEEWFNIAKRSFECTKFMMSLKVFLMKYYYGNQGFKAYIENLYDLGHQFGTLIKTTADFELFIVPPANIVCFRYIHEGNLNTGELNILNGRIRQKVLERGNYYLVQTTLGNGLWLRCTLMSPFTTMDTLMGLLEEIRKLGVEFIKQKSA